MQPANNRHVAKISQGTNPISYNVPFCNRNVHVCTFLLQNGELWGICLMAVIHWWWENGSLGCWSWWWNPVRGLPSFMALCTAKTCMRQADWPHRGPEMRSFDLLFVGQPKKQLTPYWLEATGCEIWYPKHCCFRCPGAEQILIFFSGLGAEIV